MQPDDSVLLGAHHVPVLLAEVMALLRPKPGERVLDGTVGLGGHAARLLAEVSPEGTLYAVDRDPDALSAAQRILRATGGAFVLIHDSFDRALTRPDLPPLDKILLDLGVSSMQLDRPERGFSFSRPGPLDMRMDPTQGRTAADVVNTAPEEELSRIFSAYGEEPRARRVAREIVKRRPFETTEQLARAVAAAAGRNPSGAHPATRVFQALRIAVNDELGALERALPAALDKLVPGGRLAVITFHSLEDRLVKRFIRGEAKGCVCPPRLPACACGRAPRVRDLTPRPIVPSEAELGANPRSRSAKLRGAERI
ncbi:MAG: 16S rRNA (cytosine(1402)-N(4))-methyltransferase RsmH [Candidatus Sericytochromatia bacterium]|nr:16S rRNA (cytosine(1402)-N(4))-methyltransferase RsmH [Candidatus Tanganyikabacteria bacterium]